MDFVFMPNDLLLKHSFEMKKKKNKKIKNSKENMQTFALSPPPSICIRFTVDLKKLEIKIENREPK